MTTTPISIRSATLDDLETLLKFEQGVIEAERPMDTFLAKREIYYYNIPELISSENSQLVVAVCNKELVGSGYIRIENTKQYHKNPQFGYIGFIFVKPNFRGQKISNLVIENLKNWAIEKELKELRLDVYNANFGAIKAYERFGFIKSLINMRMDI